MTAVGYGSLVKDNGKFGFIKQDSGEDDMFVLAPIGGSLPPLGSRICYEIIIDAKTGKPRAENIQPESAPFNTATVGHATPRSSQAEAPPLQAGQHSGSMFKDNGKFGFIKQDAGGEDMFVLAPIGGALPPLGARVVYEVVMDSKTGRPRAENVRPEGAHSATQRTGTFLKDNGKFGFIQQDCGEEDMFMLPPFPPPGSQVMYDVVQDPKTGRPRAENVMVATVQPAHAPMPSSFAGPTGPSAHNVHASMQAMGLRTGTLVKDNGKFGFIQQDCGEEDMFALAPMGGSLPPLGTRVVYEVMVDRKTGRPRAENIDYEAAGVAMVGAAMHQGAMQQSAMHQSAMHQPAMHQPAMHQPAMHQGAMHQGAMHQGGNMYPTNAPMMAGGQRAGTLLKDNGKFGFIKQDTGEEDMFVLAPIGGALPPVGTRIAYDVVADAKTGRPRAENIQPEGAGMAMGAAMAMGGAPMMMMGGQRSGTFVKVSDSGKFGFIQQDCGEDDMFMLPPHGGFPEPGTRVMYDVVTDPKTGRPRADNVQPGLPGPAMQGSYGNAGKGKGKGKAVRSGPY